MADLGYGRGWLNPAEAASVRRMDAQLGYAMQISEAGRTNERQWYLWNLYYVKNSFGQWVPRPASQRPDWLGKPAYPGTSPHEQGNAIDTEQYRTHGRMLLENGWRRTISSEPWHWVYNSALDRYYGQPAGGGNVVIPPNPKDIMTPEQAQQLSAVYAAIFGPANLGAKETTWLNVDGEMKKAYYGLLDIDIYTQSLVQQTLAATRAIQSIDLDALAAKIIAGLPSGTITKADVSSAVVDGLNNLVLRSVEQGK